MKKILIPALATTVLAISGCATDGVGTNNTLGTATNVGVNLFKASVDTKCRSELQNQQAWRAARYVMTAQQESQIATKICGCVSEKAPQQVTVVDMTNAAIDPNQRTQIVSKAVANTLQACIADFVK